jgi:hypothetical protein
MEETNGLEGQSIRSLMRRQNIIKRKKKKEMPHFLEEYQEEERKLYNLKEEL